MRNTFFLMNPLARLADELDHFFTADTTIKSSYPAVNIRETDQQVIVQALLPGAKKEQIEIVYDQGVLTLKGSNKITEEKEGERYHRHEIRQSAFERSFKLRAAVDGESASAQFEDGVLIVRFDKLEQAKPKQITVE